MDFRECMHCLVLHPSGCGHYFFGCQVPALEGSCWDLAGKAVTLHLLWEPRCLEMESGGKREEVGRRVSAAQTKMGK